MNIVLNQREQELKSIIEEQVKAIRKALKEQGLSADFSELVSTMGSKAHELHMLLKERGLEPKHHGYMIENRGLQPDDSGFYEHVHPVEDLLAFLEDPHANDDPIDQTIGEDFIFRVYSRRWGHHDPYSIKRTEYGWYVMHLAIGGPCDKGGRPYLFDNFRQDSIQYPHRLDGWFEWLWDQAECKGLTKEEVQAALDDVAAWVSLTEENTPRTSVWRGYC